MDFDIKIHGLKELAKGLKDLANRKAGEIFKAAVQAGAVELSRVVKGNVPQRSGALRKGITTKRFATGSYFKARSLVMSNVYYGVMLEKGWNTVKTGRYNPVAKKRFRRDTFPNRKKLPPSRRDVISRVPARPFMRPAFDTGKNQVLDKVGASMGAAIAREFAKLGRH